MGDCLLFIPLAHHQPLSCSALDDILKAAGCPDANVDRDKLKRELALANHWESIQPLFANSAVTDQVVSARKIADEAERLLDRLFENPSSNLSKWKAPLLELAREARREAELVLPRMDLAVSAIQWVIGEYLAGIYLRVTGRKAGVSTNQDSQRGGPFVRFVEAVLHFNNICNDDGTPYSTETIKKALSQVRKARSGNTDQAASDAF